LGELYLDRKRREHEVDRATSVTKKKFENLKYGEQIMAAIDTAEELREE